jgi:hypothetical protein
VNEITTLRRHLEAHHSGRYHKWAKSANFESRLPSDVKDRKVAATASAQSQTLEQHLSEQTVTERVVPYSDSLFRQAAIEWIVATDQPLRALEHLQFKEMINIAARATKGVKIPGRRATRAHIKRTFKDHLTSIKARLQGSSVPGEVSLTCDAWQASNTDGYFAVTGHWIEEIAVAQWELKSSLLGFARVSNAHNGERLGQVLFKIIKRVGIENKVSSFFLYLLS